MADRSKYQSEWYQRNKKKKAEYAADWRRKNPSATKLIWARTLQKLRLEVLSAYSKGKPHCACCGEDEMMFLALDHVNGGGNNERKNGGGSYGVYRRLRAAGYPKGYRVLCHNCNQAIGHWGRCSHKHA